MRILQLMGTLDRGGVEAMVINLLQNGLKTDICLEIPDKGAMEDTARELGAEVYHLTRRSTSMLRHHKELYRIAKDYDIVHIHAQNSLLALLEVLVLRGAGVKKVIVHSHNTKDWRKTGIIQKLSRPFLRRSCIPAACSSEAGEWMFGTRNVAVIPLPVDVGKFQFDKRTRERERKKMHLSKTVLLHAGNFREAKNHTFLIDVFRVLALNHPDEYVLLLAGEGGLRKEIETYARGLPVRFMGSIQDMPTKMMAADIFLLPSLNEGLPTVVLEAQTSGLPCLVSDLVTREAAVTDLVDYLPLDVEAWIERIEKIKCVRGRKAYADVVGAVNGINKTMEAFLSLYGDGV